MLLKVKVCNLFSQLFSLSLCIISNYYCYSYLVIARPDISTSFYLYYDCIVNVGNALLNLTCLSIKS